jgi:hypothetical protein
MAGFTWPEPPERMLVVSCSVCKAYLGIRDVDRMQHEHFEQSSRCRGGHYRAAVYERKLLGTYSEALREMRAAQVDRGTPEP